MPTQPSPPGQPPEPKQQTAWHPPFVAALRTVLPPSVYQVLAELLLNHQPQRIDVIVRLLEEPARDAPGPGMAPLLRHLGRRVTAIEFKGPTVALRGEDLLVLLGYAYQYRVLHSVPRQDLSLMVVANRLTGPFREAVLAEGGRLSQEQPGVLVVQGLCHPLCVIETSRAQDPVLHMFSGEMLNRPAHLFSLLTEQERAIFRAIYREVKRLRSDPGAAMKYPDVEEMTMSAEELLDEILDDAPKEKLLKRLSPEDRLRGLSPEDMLKRLSPEDRLRGLSPQDLTPELREQLKKLLS